MATARFLDIVRLADTILQAWPEPSGKRCPSHLGAVILFH